MSRMHWLPLVLLVSFVTSAWSAEEEPIFSGPQPGEKLPGFQVAGVFGDQAGQDIDLVQAADGQPLVLVFFHARTRPAFGLTNTIMRYAITRKEAGLVNGVVFLTDDATETENWLKRVQKHFPQGAQVGISQAGQEGPGSYGLNRNVTLTILVAKDNKVTANFALVQPSIQADGPKILKAIVDATGGGEVPDIRKFAAGRTPAPAKRNNDAKLESLLRAVINKSATPEQVAAATADIDAYVKDNEKAQRELGRISNTVVNSGKLENYGTQPAQDQLKKWAEKYASKKPADGKR